MMQPMMQQTVQQPMMQQPMMQTTVQQPMMQQPMMQQTTVQQPMMQPMVQQTTVQQPMMQPMMQQTVVQQPTPPMVQVVQQPQMVIQQQPMIQTVVPAPVAVQTVVQQPQTTTVTRITFFKNVSTKNSCDFVVMIDKSGSMSTRGRWQEAQRAVALVTTACCRASPEGITVFFFGSPGSLQKFTNVKSGEQVISLFQKCRPAGTTCLDGALANAFESHFQKPKKLPTSILVITDGEPNSKQAVVKEIMNAANRCQTPHELAVSFLQVGNDAACTRFLRKIDKCRMKARYPIVDTLSHDQVANFEAFVKSATS